ncbi:MAG: exodeoxyribonuclease V subunit gamma, partial [Ignavibacteriales bacterium]|nr:exodeoxyribonuclease V subunit gamma [Ignavibacteriales bacterium]
MSLRVEWSDRLELLADALADDFRAGDESPFEAREVIVQSRGMERWISTAIAKRNGCASNLRFPFPLAFLLSLFRAAGLHASDVDRFESDRLAWAILRELDDALDEPRYAPVRAYLGLRGAAAARFDVAAQIADTFDRYLMRRPRMLMDWERSGGGDWQGDLWRRLVKRLDGGHVAALGDSFFKLADNGDLLKENLPKRVAVFGVSYLPPFMIQAFSALSRYVDVAFYLLNPCREYWGDVASRRNREDETTNPLLASFGKSGRDFFDFLLDENPEIVERFEEREERDLLSAVQSDIRDARNGAIAETKRVVASDDRSIVVNNCHSSTREAETLRDELLALFAADPTLEPKDVLVVAPNVDEYAPFIQAAFDVSEHDTRHIPYSVADRRARDESDLFDAFFATLDYASGRHGAAEALDLFSFESIADRLRLGDEEFAALRLWIKETGARWGFDKEDRAARGLPAVAHNTWEAAFERVLLGAAIGEDAPSLYRSVLPYAEIEGDDLDAFEKLQSTLDRLRRLAASLKRPKTLVAWADEFERAIEAFLADSTENAKDRRYLRAAIAELRDVADDFDYTASVEYGVVRAWLSRRVERRPSQYGFFTGGVTFSAAVPARSIPFRVVAMIGMNRSAFPRLDRFPGFDVSRTAPKRGDRARRDDDRYLFLEALVSARDVFYLSYVGQDEKDNSLAPPASPVEETLDYLRRSFQTETGEDADQFVLSKRRLHAHSAAHFGDDPRRFTFDRQSARVAAALSSRRRPPAPFVVRALPKTRDDEPISFARVAKFFGNPARGFLENRFDARFRRFADGFIDKEPFTLDGLERFIAGADIVTRLREGRSAEDVYELKRAEGTLPHGAAGRAIFEDLLGKAIEVRQAIVDIVGEERPLDSRNVEVSINGVPAIVPIENVYPNAAVGFRIGNISPRDEVEFFAKHASLALVDSSDIPERSVFVGYSANDNSIKSIVFERTIGLGHYAKILIERYRTGLSEPLPFFPAASMKYVKQSPEGKERAQTLARFSLEFANADDRSEFG